MTLYNIMLCNEIPFTGKQSTFEDLRVQLGDAIYWKTHKHVYKMIITRVEDNVVYALPEGSDPTKEEERVIGYVLNTYHLN